MLDLFKREVVGWSLKPAMTAELVTDAVTITWFRRRPGLGVVVHSDRDSQYASSSFQSKLAAYGMTCTMSHNSLYGEDSGAKARQCDAPDRREIAD